MRMLCLLLAIGGWGCVVKSNAQLSTARKLPEKFRDGDEVTENAAAIRWQAFFEEEDLIQLIDECLKENLDLKRAYQRVETVRANVQQATGQLFPQLGASATLGARRYGLYTMDGAGNATTDITPGQRVPVDLPDYQLGLQASWEVDVWGRLRHQREAAIYQYLASVEGNRWLVSQLVADVAIAYFELQALLHAESALQRSLEQQTKMVEMARFQKEAGRANELAVQQFRAQLADTQALSALTAQKRLEAANILQVLLGRWPSVVFGSHHPLRRPSRTLLAGLPADLLRNRPDIREAEKVLQATAFDVSAAKAAFLPSVTLSAGVGLQAFNPSFFFRPDSIAYSLVGGLLAPLVNRSGIEAQFAKAKAQQLEAMYQYQQVILKAFVEVVNGLGRVEASVKVFNARRDRVVALAKSIADAEALFRSGKASYLDVLLAQQNGLQSELESIEAWKDERISSVLLYRALGGGWGD